MAMAWAPALLAYLRRLKFGKQIREEGPQSHHEQGGHADDGRLADGRDRRWCWRCMVLRDWQQFVCRS
jgi:hypothetical protein